MSTSQQQKEKQQKEQQQQKEQKEQQQQAQREQVITTLTQSPPLKTKESSTQETSPLFCRRKSPTKDKRPFRRSLNAIPKKRFVSVQKYFILCRRSSSIVQIQLKTLILMKNNFFETNYKVIDLSCCLLL
jgi:hypothetical protein